MKTKLKSRDRWPEQLAALLFASILIAAAAILIREDVVRITLTCLVFLVATAITGYGLGYFHPKAFGRERFLKRIVRRFHGDRSGEIKVAVGDERKLHPDCPVSDNRQKAGLTRESQLDAAVERIVRGIDRDMGVEK
jgi:hypothetical protein